MDSEKFVECFHDEMGRGNFNCKILANVPQDKAFSLKEISQVLIHLDDRMK